MPEQAQAFLKRLAIGEFRGVGAKTKPILEDMGINTGADLLEYSQADLVQHFGKMGLGLYQHARGIDNRPVLVRDRKSIGKERTYRAVKTTDAQVEQELKHLAEMVAETLAAKQKHGKTVVIKVRDRDFNTITRRTSLPQFINQANDIFTIELKPISKDELDDLKPDLKDWIALLETEKNEDMGKALFIGMPGIRSRGRGLTDDIDVTGAYPTATVALNVSNKTTRMEACKIEGLNRFQFREVGVNYASSPKANALSLCTTLHRFPTITEIEKVYNKLVA